MKNSRVKRAVAHMLLIAFAMISGNATAATVSYDLFGDAKLGPIYGGQKLATVTLTDNAGGGVNFDVETVIAGSLISKFGFNFLANAQPSGFSISSLPSSWGYTVDVWTGGGSGNGGFNGFGKFDVSVKDGGSAGRLSPLIFDVSVGTIGDYIAENNKAGQFFSAHVTNLNLDEWGSCSAADNGVTCTALTGYTGDPMVVPVPAAVWLFGSGLLGLIGIARRKKA